MADLKRKVERIHKVNIKRPSVECFCKDEGLVVKLYYDGEIATKLVPGTYLSHDDLILMDRDITETFKELPWYDMTGLMNIVEWMLDEHLCSVI